MMVLRVINICTQTLNIIGSLLIIGVMLLIGADVIGRGVFLSPIAGVPEIVSLAIVAIVFLQLPSTLNTGRLTRSDAVLNKITGTYPRLAKHLETTIDMMAIAMMAVIFRFSLPLLQKSWTTQQFVGAIGDFTAPTWPVKLIILMGTAMLILQFIVRIVNRYTANDTV